MSTTKTAKAFIVYNKTDKTFLCYETNKSFFHGDSKPRTDGSVHLGAGMVASKALRPSKDILVVKSAAEKWARRGNRALGFPENAKRKGTYHVIEVNVGITF